MKSLDVNVCTTFYMDIDEDEVIAAAVTMAADMEGVDEKVVTMTDEQFAAWCAKEERNEREMLAVKVQRLTAEGEQLKRLRDDDARMMASQREQLTHLLHEQARMQQEIARLQALQGA